MKKIMGMWLVVVGALTASFAALADARVETFTLGYERMSESLAKIDRDGSFDTNAVKLVVIKVGVRKEGEPTFGGEVPADTILGFRSLIQALTRRSATAKILFAIDSPANDTVTESLRKLTDGKRILIMETGQRGIAGLLRIYTAAILSDGKKPIPKPQANHTSRWPANTPKSAIPTDCIRRDQQYGYDWWLDRLARNRKLIAESKGEFDLVFCGDSITHFWETVGSNTYAKITSKYSVLNLGYAGDLTENLAWRGLNGEMDGYKAKCVMVLCGANNIGFRWERAEMVAAGVKKVIAVIREKQPQAKIILMGLFPLGGNEDDSWRLTTKYVNKLIAPLGDNETVFWVNIREKFIDDHGSTAKTTLDTVHPNAESYENIWLPAVEPLFKKFCGK